MIDEEAAERFLNGYPSSHKAYEALKEAAVRGLGGSGWSGNKLLFLVLFVLAFCLLLWGSRCGRAGRLRTWFVCMEGRSMPATVGPQSVSSWGGAPGSTKQQSPYPRPPAGVAGGGGPGWRAGPATAPL